MSISVFKIKKWFKMIGGNSVYHVHQDEGKIYSVTEIKGYYNNLTEKVSRFGLPGTQLPKHRTDDGVERDFTIAIFQYGLAAYDLYLLNSDKSMLDKAKACADWAVSNQQSDGGWNTFSFLNEEKPYSAMAQGEAISLLLRVHIATGDEKYLNSATLAKDFMLKPIEEGGTTRYKGADLCLCEYTFKSLVLNGWIFSLWGLYDYCKFTRDSDAQEKLSMTLNTLKKMLPTFDRGYWSSYEESGKLISSPFYHDLHISQLKVMYKLFGDEIYNEYAKKWESYKKSFWKPKFAFVVKVLQKIFE